MDRVAAGVAVLPSRITSRSGHPGYPISEKPDWTGVSRIDEVADLPAPVLVRGKNAVSALRRVRHLPSSGYSCCVCVCVCVCVNGYMQLQLCVRFAISSPLNTSIWCVCVCVCVRVCVGVSVHACMYAHIYVLA